MGEHLNVSGDLREHPMKVQCDVCNKHEASLFCTADEAALCDSCDHRVHHANKLASKHQRFSLHHPSSKQCPVCDVCQERRAFIFCHQDRAILCKECDLPIHSANDHTKNHTRFLLTGIKLSAVASPHSSPQSNSCVKDNSALDSSHPPPLLAETCPSTASNNFVANEESAFASSISEYLIETIPGWRVDDFLDSPSVPIGFSKNGDYMLPLVDPDIERNLSSVSAASIGGIWVPQAPSSPYSTQMNHQTKEASSRSRFGDDNFIVPQMTPANIPSKRPRIQW